MTGALHAGAARRVVNPPLGTRQTGFRLYGRPVQAIESDLTATALVLANGRAKVVVIAVDLSILGIDLSLRDARPGQELRVRVAEALDIPVAHVLVNTSHAHSGVALPDYMPDTDEQLARKRRYRGSLARRLVDAAVEADGRLRPARVGCGWGESAIGVYRRETRDGRDVLGEVPGHPIDSSVGVIRVDDLDGAPIAVAFRYSCHPVTMGPRSAVVSSDFPGVARTVVESTLGGLALFLQGGGGNVNPRAGMGFEVDCRDTKHRLGLELGGEVVKVASGIRTDTRPGERRPLGNVSNVLFTPWVAVTEHPPTPLAAAEATVVLEYVDLPSVGAAARGGGERGRGDVRAPRPGDPGRRPRRHRHGRRALLRDGPRAPGALPVRGDVRPRLHERHDRLPPARRGPPGRRLGRPRRIRRARPHLPGAPTPRRPAPRLGAARRRGDALPPPRPRGLRSRVGLDIDRTMVDPTIDS